MRLFQSIGTLISNSYYIKLSTILSRFNQKMATNISLTGADPEIILASFREAVRQAGLVVSTLSTKLNSADNDADKKSIQAEYTKAISQLREKQKSLADTELKLRPQQVNFERRKLEELLKRRFFYSPSFPLYPSVAGFYDFGPMGCALKSNILTEWRAHFVLAEQLLEVDCTIITPEPVLRASGHVEKFSDYMVKDEKSGECFRADHLLEEFLEKLMKDKKSSSELKARCEELLRQVDNFDKQDIQLVINEFKICSPTTGSPLSEPVAFNLMFPTSIGPSGQMQGYLRPETAQGIFVNFKRLLEFNNSKMPFGAAQIGQSFRNEISPRSGLLRVREFTLAEIEYFVDPKDKNHPKFHQVADLELNLLSACNQMEGKSVEKISIGSAVSSGLVNNQTLGYFLTRIHLFLVKIGADPGRMRFRQHLNNEMAHYASDCWDLEMLTSYGWIECVGCADRSCYDLDAHAKYTKTEVFAKRPLPEPVIVEVVNLIPNRSVIGKTFKGDGKFLVEYLSCLDQPQIIALKNSLIQGPVDITLAENKLFQLTAEMVEFKESKSTIQSEDYTPGVIEPSFGIGRILYSLLEHNFQSREGDEQRNWLSLPTCIAPCTCSVLPLSNHPSISAYIQRISDSFSLIGVSHKIDDGSGSIGRRYARTDEIAIPFGVTIDFDTPSNDSVTLRERNTMKQIRVPINELASVVYSLKIGRTVWSEICKKYPEFISQETVSKVDP